MTVLWQRTDISTVDADGSYIDDLAAGIDNVVGFDLSILTAASEPEEVTIVTVSATLSRYREAYERTSPSVADRVEVDGELDAALNGATVNITIPSGTMDVGRTYQLLIVATDDTGASWPKTREYRAVA